MHGGPVEPRRVSRQIAHRIGRLGPAAFAALASMAVLLAAPWMATAQGSDTTMPTVATTDYPIPPRALFVSPEGSDRSAGTRRRPLRTVSAALTRARAGATIVLRGGTYREALGTIDKTITLQPYPGETAWLKGSIVVTGWRRNGSVWGHDGWSHAFCATCFHPGNIEKANPQAGLPDQVFVDGRPLRQVVQRRDLVPGTFMVDSGRKQLLVGDDPTGRTVEAVIRDRALTLVRGSEGSLIRGIAFAHYSPTAEPGLGGMVKADAGGLAFEHNTFAFSAVKGLSIYGENARVADNTFVSNGMMGLETYKAHGLEVTGNRFANNNTEGFVQTGDVSEAAGAKIVTTRDVTIADNWFEDNRATGLWLDIDVVNATVVRNVMRNNERHGLYFEISTRALIASNAFLGNGVSGVGLADATGARVLNNTFVDNPVALLVQDDARDQSDPAAFRKGSTWSSGDNMFRNNLVVGGMLAWVRDYTGRLDPANMLPSSDANAYRPSPGVPAAEWWRAGRRVAFDTLADYGARTKRERRSILLDGNGRPIDGNVGIDGDDLPSDFARAIGISGVRPGIGAPLLPDGVEVPRLRR